jgi:hypothetical protein
MRRSFRKDQPFPEWGNVKSLTPGTGRLFWLAECKMAHYFVQGKTILPQGGLQKVFLHRPEDFSNMGDGRTSNSKAMST